MYLTSHPEGRIGRSETPITYSECRILALEEAACGESHVRSRVRAVRGERAVTAEDAPPRLQSLIHSAAVAWAVSLAAFALLLVAGIFLPKEENLARLAFWTLVGSLLLGAGAMALYRVGLGVPRLPQSGGRRRRAPKGTRPDPSDLVRVLTKRGKGSWDDLEARLEAIAEERPSPEALGGMAQSGMWVERLAAMNGLAALGERSLPILLSVAQDGSHPSQGWAAALLEERLGAESRRAQRKALELVCRKCMARVRPHPVSRGQGTTFDYYACGNCRGTVSLKTAPGGITAVLGGEGTVRRIDGVFEMDPLDHQGPFEVDRIRVETGDETAIEALVLRIENDPADARREHNRGASVEVATGVEIGRARSRASRSDLSVLCSRNGRTRGSRHDGVGRGRPVHCSFPVGIPDAKAPA